MMGLDLGAIATIILSLIGFVVWLVRLEGRINTETQLRESQVGSMIRRLDGFEERIYDVLERIESKLDRKLDRP